MFLIRCSILNYVNADIEESQYYISQDLKILPYYLIAFQKKVIPTCKILVEIYSHCKGQCLALSSAKDHHRKDKHEYIHTKLQNTRPLTTMVLWEKLCCWKLYKHMISYNFLYLFLNQRTYMFSLMHTVTRNNSQCKPVSISSLHVWQFLLSEIGPHFKGHRSLVLACLCCFFFPPKMENASKKKKKDSSYPFRNRPL